MERTKQGLAGKNIVIYDLEIKKTIEECAKGWQGFDEMGISTGCAFDYSEMRYRVFMDDNLTELTDRLNKEGTLVVAFNHVGFDNKLLKANDVRLKDSLNNYDMLLVSREGSGCKDKYQKGFKLDDHLKALGLNLKTANGALAPLWWKEGRKGRVVDYCLNDVKVERELFEYVWTTGKLACAYQPKPYDVILPGII